MVGRSHLALTYSNTSCFSGLLISLLLREYSSHSNPNLAAPAIQGEGGGVSIGQGGVSTGQGGEGQYRGGSVQARGGSVGEGPSNTKQ